MSNEDDRYTLETIEKDSVLKAEKLSKYFIAMSKKIKGQSTERKEMKTIINKSEGKSNYDKFSHIYEGNKEVNKTELASIIGVSRNTIYKYIKEYENNLK